MASALALATQIVGGGGGALGNSRSHPRRAENTDGPGGKETLQEQEEGGHSGFLLQLGC